MANTAVDTSYRSWGIDTLQAARTSVLIQMKAVEGVGQSHSANGRQTALPDFDKLFEKLNNIENAIAWKLNPANRGNNGFASRTAAFN